MQRLNKSITIEKIKTKQIKLIYKLLFFLATILKISQVTKTIKTNKAREILINLSINEQKNLKLKKKSVKQNYSNNKSVDNILNRQNNNYQST